MKEATDTDKRFQHLPLDGRAEGQIRLVRIKPSCDSQSSVHLELQFMNIHDIKTTERKTQRESRARMGETESKTESETEKKNDDRNEGQIRSDTPITAFTALSYTWGDEFPQRQVYMEHGDKHGWYSVRQNLFDFLRTRRVTENPSPWFWIDQVCIDQTNFAEKCHQVSQMFLIYSIANVEIWLGSAFEGSEGAIELIRSAYETDLETIPKKLVKPHIRALRQLADLPYWSRVWIVQEVRLGISWDRDATIRVGAQSIPWSMWREAFGRFWEVPEGLDLPVYLPRRSRNRIRPLVHDRIARFGEWSELCYLVSDRQCANFHDKAFGVLSIAEKRSRFSPDYNMTREELLFQILNKQLQYFPDVNYHGDIVPTAREWLHILDETHTEIDTKTVRSWILQEVHRVSRRRRKETEEETHKLVNLFYPIGKGPDGLARIRLRWKIPGNGSLRWRSRWLSRGLHSGSGLRRIDRYQPWVSVESFHDFWRLVKR